MAYVLDESIGFLVHCADLALVNHLLSLFKPHDLTVEQWKVLNRLVEQDGQTQRELARKNAKDPTTLVRILDKMEEKGLVERRDHAHDRRVFRITITDKGRALQAKLAPFALQSSRDAVQGMTAAEVSTLKRLLRKIQVNLQPLRDTAVGDGSADSVLALGAISPAAAATRRRPHRARRAG